MVACVYPHVAVLLNRWLRQRLMDLDDEEFDNPLENWKWAAVIVNANYGTARHVDKNNHGPSIIRSLGRQNDSLLIWPQGVDRKPTAVRVSSEDTMVAFDGTTPHRPKRMGECPGLYSIVFFQPKQGWDAPRHVLNASAELDYNLCDSQDDAEQFKLRYRAMAAGNAFRTWKVRVTSSTAELDMME